MSHAGLLGFVAVSVAIVAVPGPSVLFAISRAVSSGRRVALLTVFGNAVGLFVQVLVVSLGLGVIVSDSGVATGLLRLVGGGYLVWLGVSAIRHRAGQRAAIRESAPSGGSSRPLRDGFVVGASNPKSLVFLAALLPAHLDAGDAAAPQMLLLGGLFCCLALVCDSAWAVAASYARRWLSGEPRRLRTTSVAGGVVMMLLGLVMALG